jgi:riboflavin biosynthesis pyrimidine reductase
MIAVGHEFGIRLLLQTFGQFLAAKMIDELFLTLAPQIAGRHSLAQRPSIVRQPSCYSCGEVSLLQLR